MSCSGFLIIVTIICQNSYPDHAEFLLLFATFFHAYFQIKYSDIFLDKFLFLKWMWNTRQNVNSIFYSVTCGICDFLQGNYKQFRYNRLKSDIYCLIHATVTQLHCLYRFIMRSCLTISATQSWFTSSLEDQLLISSKGW